MSNSEIYHAPDAELRENVLDTYKLASISKRFWATIIDRVTLIAPILLGFWFFDPQEYYWKDYDTALLVYSGVVGLLFLVLNIWLLIKNGQTIGKKLLKIAIVSYNDNEKLDLFSLLFLRHVLFWIGDAFLGVLWLIDGLFIFSREKRCLHDLAASTKVIDLQNNL
ncbi:RDD family protein [Zooshikella marina]|uniref:RDD family protein n=1 Tax=Zooshikella ganghwensis TaxID=202772 RepID=A0A4P9VQX6_9GAMM|nr:RDD family protein [Zooshikella ganghwensis]MBU2709302.1 RDD family protein [Zooshikella ganghwensis]RDH44774.1 RDD family protein [Zooshikella ganghwensis]